MAENFVQQAFREGRDLHNMRHPQEQQHFLEKLLGLVAEQPGAVGKIARYGQIANQLRKVK